MPRCGCINFIVAAIYKDRWRRRRMKVSQQPVVWANSIFVGKPACPRSQSFFKSHSRFAPFKAIFQFRSKGFNFPWLWVSWVRRLVVKDSLLNSRHCIFIFDWKFYEWSQIFWLRILNSDFKYIYYLLV
jgi:hypothetical protein